MLIQTETLILTCPYISCPDVLSHFTLVDVGCRVLIEYTVLADHFLFASSIYRLKLTFFKLFLGLHC
jgi:hypothetical protein